MEEYIHPDRSKHGPAHINVQQEYSTTSEQPKSNTSNKALISITQRTKRIIQKLAVKRQQLQKNSIEKNSNNMVASDGGASKILQSVGDDAGVQVKLFKPNELTENEVQNPPKQQSKEQLDALVDGLHVLIMNLASDNTRLKTMVETAAQQIYSLKDFPLYPNEIKSKRSELSNKKLTKASAKYYLDRKVEETIRKEHEKQHSNSFQAIKFAEYINNMISEYLGKDQQNKLEKVKCVPAHIEELETFANELVREGYGCIVENKICINRNNNLQAFIPIKTNVQANIKYGITTTPFARRYAFDGDIVRAFILNGNTAYHKIPKKFLIEEDCDLLFLEKDSCAKAFVIKIVELNMNSIQSYYIFDELISNQK